MRIKEVIKYFLRFLILQIILTTTAIYYFDSFLIGDYLKGYEIIIFNLIEDRDRFYPIISNSLIKIDLYLGLLVFIFLIALYSTNFYTYVNELAFKEKKNNLEDFLSIYLLWTSFLFVFITLFRFTSVSRLYLFLFTFIVPAILVVFRNSEAISSVLGRSPSNENYLTVNLSSDSIFKNMRIMSIRNSLGNIKIDNINNYESIIKQIDEKNKNENLNLVVINLHDQSNISANLLKYLINLNKKILIISKNEVEFETYFLKRRDFISGNHLIYFNNDIQYGAKYIIKRGLDVVLSFFALILFLPLIIFVSIFILLTDGFPFYIKQERVGLHGKKFKMYKFRTMQKNAHLQRDGLDEFNERDEILFKIQNDPRILKNASFIRKYSLDELLQFINVIKGEMSIVGPRPLFEEDTKQYSTDYMRRLNVLPGITGLLQISNRNTPDFHTWYEFDMMYIENWSIGLDLKIIIKTPYALLKGINSKGL